MSGNQEMSTHWRNEDTYDHLDHILNPSLRWRWCRHEKCRCTPLTLLSVLQEHHEGIGSVKKLFTASDKTIRVYDADSLERIALLDGHNESVRALAIGPLHGKMGGAVYSGSIDGSIAVWDAVSYECLQ